MHAHSPIVGQTDFPLSTILLFTRLTKTHMSEFLISFLLMLRRSPHSSLVICVTFAPSSCGLVVVVPLRTTFLILRQGLVCTSFSSVSCSLFPTGSPSVLRNLLAPYGLPPQFLSALHDLVYGETPPQSYHIPYSVVPPYGLPSSPLQGICVFFVVGNSFLP